MTGKNSVTGSIDDIIPLDSIAGLMDSAILTDGLKADIQQMRENIDHSVINGYVTVIKNAGRPDEEEICRDIHNLLVDNGRE